MQWLNEFSKFQISDTDAEVVYSTLQETLRRKSEYEQRYLSLESRTTDFSHPKSLLNNVYQRIMNSGSEFRNAPAENKHTLTSRVDLNEAELSVIRNSFAIPMARRQRQRCCWQAGRSSCPVRWLPSPRRGPRQTRPGRRC